MTHGLKFFRLSEFDCPTAPGSGINMQPSTLAKLDEARRIAGMPFKINSGYRTAAHNEEVGGVAGSSHCAGHAADIRYKTHREAARIIAACTQAGFRRIGLAKSFVHVDDDPHKPTPAYWDYS